MKRRLSVACSLISDPAVVYLDEPTTGMDPVNRRGVWDVIEKAKHGRVVVLTTHAMEEAETLGDRVGIMSRGRLLCLGSTLHLKRRYGYGYALNIACAPDAHSKRRRILELVSAHAQQAAATARGVNARITTETAPTAIPALQAALSAEGLEMTLNMCSLEEVFIALAEAAQDPEWLRLKYGEEEKARIWEAFTTWLNSKKKAGARGTPGARGTRDPTAGSPAMAQVASSQSDGDGAELTEASGGAADVSRRRAAKRAAELEGSEEEKAVLADTLSFRSPSVGLQLRAVYQKNNTYQKKQRSANRGFFFMTIYMLALLWVSDSIIGIIIGEPYIECKRSVYPSSLTGEVSQPFTSTVAAAFSEIARSQGKSDESCTDDDRDQQESLSRFNAWTPKICTSRVKDQLKDHERERLETILVDFGCDLSKWHELSELYSYLRNDPSIEDVCKEEGRPTISITIANVTMLRTNLGCNEAVSLFRTSCSAAPRECGDAESKDRRRLLSEPSPHELRQHRHRLRQLRERSEPKPHRLSTSRRRADEFDALSEFECSADADARTEALSWDSIHEYMVPGAIIPVHIASCVGTQVCALGCTGAVSRLASIGFPYATCDGSDPTAGMTPSQTTALASSYYASSNDDQREADDECLWSAYHLCRANEIFSACPGLDLHPKRLPFSHSLSDTELRALGSLVYDPSVINRAACVTTNTCGSAWLTNAPTLSSGTLAGFTLREPITGHEEWAESHGENEAARSGRGAMDISCVPGFGVEGGGCTAARADLDQHIFEIWNHADRDDIHVWTPENPIDESFREGAYQGAFHFSRWSLSPPAFEYTVLFNGTWFPRQFIDEFGASQYFGQPEVAGMMNRLHAAIFKELSGNAASDLIGSTMGFPEPANVWDGISLMRILGPIAFVCMTTILYPVIVGRIVSEKAGRLREIMVMSGLRRGPYWLINWVHSFVEYFWICVLIFLFCYLFPSVNPHDKKKELGFAVFTGNDPLVLLLLFGLHGMALVSFSFFTSTLFNNKTISVVVPLIFLFVLGPTSWITSDNGLQLSASGESSQMIAALLPIFAFTNGIMMLAASVGDPHGRNGQRVTVAHLGLETFSPIGGVLAMLFFDFVLYTVLFLYCDRVLPVRCLGLHKMYPNAVAPAVVNVQFGIQPKECFGLLGSNGAGKTTTIHILCGLHAPSGGTALVGEPGAAELDIRTQMPRVQSAMGDNLLWDDLTGAEHLTFFGRLRGLRKGAQLKQHLAYWLKRVNLYGRTERKKPSKAYSGGMKRRLSVACSLIGNPRIVYLDEPSTGLDPESRRQLWHAIVAAKRDKSIILTTHALEEADMLCDRVGIMTRGQLRVLGSPAELRARFDVGYKLMLTAGNPDAAHSLIKQLVPSAVLLDAIAEVRVYQLARGTTSVGTLFEAIEAAKSQCAISDWGLSQTTLEEVFLAIVAGYGVESRADIHSKGLDSVDNLGA